MRYAIHTHRQNHPVVLLGALNLLKGEDAWEMGSEMPHGRVLTQALIGSQRRINTLACP